MEHQMFPFLSIQRKVPYRRNGKCPHSLNKSRLRIMAPLRVTSNCQQIMRMMTTYLQYCDDDRARAQDVVVGESPPVRRSHAASQPAAGALDRCDPDCTW
ncbi:hypothetical protein MPTK1_3g20160 [Marchantia polymorpha subsp. ruderalis]|uniref:Uncharacterized protein n=2 Tax=Marchantia polymorpha TaxID=3197 RepID=A0AAF6B2U1_MARPO|nr:hypothetical protein MARPO_0049s0017 [Marchantia polymorpha]BBN06325.1 hypothetical protein Mp_3g20160 [Marchantia polymorpha subsp. ruderalis]|eukprot:PTQ38717.1 hypothetical protein MARPO_0049s0017 [Marchantia polymorpha]